jgi:glycosyltransferase involved in cell wall biosynthesis
VPTVSILLTVFTRTTWLADAIASALNQTFDDLELIVTDDANQPQTRDICARFRHDPRLRYRANPSPLGVPLNLAAALAEARGQFIAILNDDDLLHPQMLQKLIVPLQQNPDPVLAFANHNVIDPHGTPLPAATRQLMGDRARDGLPPGLIPQPLDFAVRGGLMAGMACLVRADALAPSWLISDVAGACDFWLAIKLAARGPFYFVPEPLMSWRQHPDSITARPSPDKFAAETYIYSCLARTPFSPPLAAHVTNQLANTLFVRGREHLARRWSTAAARRFLRQSLQTQWHFHTFRYWCSTFLPWPMRQASIKAWRNARSVRDVWRPKITDEDRLIKAKTNIEHSTSNVQRRTSGSSAVEVAQSK